MILRTKYPRQRLNDSTAHGYARPRRAAARARARRRARARSGGSVSRGSTGTVRRAAGCAPRTLGKRLKKRPLTSHVYCIYFCLLHLLPRRIELLLHVPKPGPEIFLEHVSHQCRGHRHRTPLGDVYCSLQYGWSAIALGYRLLIKLPRHADFCDGQPKDFVYPPWSRTLNFHMRQPASYCQAQ